VESTLWHSWGLALLKRCRCGTSTRWIQHIPLSARLCTALLGYGPSARWIQHLGNPRSSIRLAHASPRIPQPSARGEHGYYYLDLDSNNFWKVITTITASSTRGLHDRGRVRLYAPPQHVGFSLGYDIGSKEHFWAHSFMKIQNPGYEFPRRLLLGSS
jgi:hypothetical protein